MVRVSYYKFTDAVKYPVNPPFDPGRAYPELNHLYQSDVPIQSGNVVYDCVRNLLATLGLDKERFDTPNWNPFGDLVGEGQSVLIKPNLVLHTHLKKQGVFWIVSHPAVMRAMADYALLAVGPQGRVTIGDTPLENCDFDNLIDAIGLRAMVHALMDRGFSNLELLDFRTFQTTQYPDGSIEKQALSGDPRGYTEINLARHSLLQELEDRSGEQNYYTLGDHTVDHLNPKTRQRGLSNRYHSSGRHVYRIPNTVLDANLVIDIAKLKTHKFSGVTLCLKNAIGICQGKEFLPHRRPGTLTEGGDSFPHLPSATYVRNLRLKRSLFSLLGGKNVAVIRSWIRRVIPAKLPHEIHTEPLYGDWYGNDTIWRTTLDLNLVLFHATRDGLDLSRPQRTFFGLIDGIIGMDHEAPMTGLPVYSRLLIAARDPLAADLLATYLMGFDPRNVPTITGAMAPQCRFLGDIVLCRKEIVGNHPLSESRSMFVPTKGWMGRLENPELEWPFN